MRESRPTRTYRGIELDEQFIPAVLEHLDDWSMRLSRTAAEWAERIALQLGLGDEEIHVLRVGALLHAMGRLGLSSAEGALRWTQAGVTLPNAETGHLTPDEEALLRRSPALLGQLVPDSKLDRVIDAVVFSGEYYDGSKSPRGLRGEAIPLFARILAVTTSFLTLTMSRPETTALSREEAAARLRLEAGRRYDPEVLAALGRALGC